MDANPYEAPAAEAPLEHRTPRRYRRWPWTYKIALFVASTFVTMFVLYLAAEFLSIIAWLNRQSMP